MRHHVLSNLDELDLDVRERAKAAARRSGLSLEEWAATVLAAKDEKRLSPRQERKPAGPEPSGPVARPPRQARPELERTFEALMAAVSAENERQTLDQASRTAIALESMASWIEQTEERLNETARTSADRQERMATALSQTFSTLKERLDSVERQALAERHGQPDTACAPALGAIRQEIERLRASIGNLATQEDIAALDLAIKGIVREMGHGTATRDLLVLAQSTAAVYRQIQALSEDVNDGLHGRIGSEIDQLKAKIDRVAETGVDRTVIEFLSSQIVDMRHDLSQRVEPRQIERLAEEVSALGRQIADLRVHQVGRSDFSALKTSLENVCAALNRTIAAQEATDVPAQLDSMSRDLAALASRPAPEPVNLDPITDQLALLTERMAAPPDGRFQQHDALTAMIERLSSQVQAVADREALAPEPLLERFDRIEDELRQVGRQADTASMEQMLRGIDSKLDRIPLQPLSLDALEEQIASLAERLARKADEPLQKVLDEAASHFRSLRNDAADIAEHAANAALRTVQGNLPDASDLDALKQGFVELKALQTRTDKKTQETLRAVQSALETLASRFTDQGASAQASGLPLEALRDASPERMPPADRLEAAVRRLHAVTLSQIEDVATAHPDRDAPPASPPVAANEPAGDMDLVNMRASFIAAARRAAQVDQAAPVPEEEEIVGLLDPPDGDEGPPTSPASLLERIRRVFDSHRRSLLLGFGFVVLATGTVQVMSSGLVPSPLPLIASFSPSQPEAPASNAQPPVDMAATGSVAAPVEAANLFHPSSLTAAADSAFSAPAATAVPKFLVDPATVGDIPAVVPAPLRQAALTGDAMALYEIALQASEGSTVPQDMRLAIHLYERSAQAGFPPAQERLAMLMEKGIGIERDAKQAAIWYERAAQGGNIRAMHNLATLLVSGQTGKPDYAAALRWYGEAAEAGLRDSQFNMGVLLARGIGTKQDLPKAYVWLALAAAHGDAEAARKRDELAGRLGAAELKATRAAIEQWHPRPVDPIANEAPAASGGQTAAWEGAQAIRVDG